MKLINEKNAFTLIELVISILISTILFFIVFTFIADSIEDLTKSNSKTVAINQIFSLRDNLNRTIRGGYMISETIGTQENSVLFLKNADGTKGVIFGVVNRETMKIQEDYTYQDNTIGYRSLSETETSEITASGGKVYDLTFFQDKIYNGLFIKDFNVEFYNSGAILDVYISSMFSENKDLYGESFSGITVDSGDLVEFNLNF